MKKKNNLELFLSSSAGQKFFNMFYSWGASVVIIGAMFKIVHFNYANEILMIGMITEALVFFVSGFDNSSTTNNITEDASNGNVVVGSSLSGGGVVNTGAMPANVGKGSGGGASVVVIGGGGSANTTGNVAANSSGTIANSTSGRGGSSVGSSGLSSSEAADNLNTGKPVSPGYAQSLSDTANNLEDFSNTIQSLNEASQKLLGAYKHITENQGFVDNLVTLNQNVTGLNEVFDTQLHTITEQMSAIRYINDSLMRMKSLYDGAIGDSYMFREESAKMTKHIEALNNVYARLLQAMTANNNNTNPTNF